MNTGDLVTRVRETAFIDTNSVDYTAARICRELTDMLRSVFSDTVVKSKGSYWLRFDPTNTAASQATYRMPPRACAGGIHSIQIAYDASENYVPLDEIGEEQALQYQLGVNQTGVPVRYILRGDRIVLFPMPDTVYKMRVFYYLQPPLLVPTTSSNNGLITGANTSTRVYTTSAAVILWLPDLSSSQVLTTGFRAEIYRSSGWAEVVAPDETVTVVTTTYTFAGTSDQSLVIPGGFDYITYPGQSMIPPLPEEYQRLLADLTAAEICRQRRQFDAQDAIEKKCGGTLLRFKDHIQPRTQGGHQTISWQNVYTDSYPRRQRSGP